MQLVGQLQQVIDLAALGLLFRNLLSQFVQIRLIILKLLLELLMVSCRDNLRKDVRLKGLHRFNDVTH